MAHRAGIVGASGYGGAELVRLLDAHPAIEIASLAAHTRTGTPVRDLYPNLGTDAVFTPVEIDRLATLDLVFLATPHGAALELGGDLHDAGVAVIDLSGAYRLPAASFADWYGEEHPHPDAAPATYGLTEWNRGAVAASRYVANPGCYPTAALLGLLPLAAHVDPATIVVDAKSGTSGAGRGLADHLHHSAVAGDIAAYGAPAHRHTGEIEHWFDALGAGHSAGSGPPRLTFTPHLLPIPRGLLATCYAAVRADRETVGAALRSTYAAEPFVRVLPEGTFPHVKAVAGSNGCQIGWVYDERTSRVTVCAAIDNLGKGAAGQALQNANLMLGLDETLGLTAIGVYP